MKPAKLTLTRYKLVTQDYTSHNNTLWRDAAGRWLDIVASRSGNELCSPDVIHFYDHPVLAVFFNPIHADITDPRLLKIRVSLPVAHDGTKGGCKHARAIAELPLPTLTIKQRVEIAIRVAQQALKHNSVKIPLWDEWAKRWLAGKTTKSLRATDALYASLYAAFDARRAYAYRGARAAEAAAHAARAAAHAEAGAAENAAAHAAKSAADSYLGVGGAGAARAVKHFKRVLQNMRL